MVKISEGSKLPIKFLIMQSKNNLIEQIEYVLLEEDVLHFAALQKVFQEKVLIPNHIVYEAYMFWPTKNFTSEEDFILITSIFNIRLKDILETEGSRKMVIVVKDYAQHISKIFELKMCSLFARTENLKRSFSELAPLSALESLCPEKHPEPISPEHLEEINVTKKKSIFVEENDVFVLHSSPLSLYDGDYADLRTEIENIYCAFNHSQGEEFSLKFEFASRLTLEKCLTTSRQKILQIICGSTENGSLYLEDMTQIQRQDSVRVEDIEHLLQGNEMPALVIIVSTHPKPLAEAFNRWGCKHVVEVECIQLRTDSVVHFFLNKFYRRVFEKESIASAFANAVEDVEVGLNVQSCSCYFNSHSPDCRWQNVVLKNMDIKVAHELYHVFPSFCDCVNRIHNKHKRKCDWMKQTVFEINEAFRVCSEESSECRLSTKFYEEEYGEEIIIHCCKPNLNWQIEAEQAKMKLLGCNKECNCKINIDEREIFDATFKKSKTIENEILSTGWREKLRELVQRVSEKTSFIYVLEGPSGSGCTALIQKAAEYLIQREVFEDSYYVNAEFLIDSDMLKSEIYTVGRISLWEQNHESSMRNTIFLIDKVDQVSKHPEFKAVLTALKKAVEGLILILVCEDSSVLSIFELGIEIIRMRSLQPCEAALFIYTHTRFYLHPTFTFTAFEKIVEDNLFLCKSTNIKLVIEYVKKIRIKIKENVLRKSLFEEFNKKENSLEIGHIVELKKHSIKEYYSLLFISQFLNGINEEEIIEIKNSSFLLYLCEKYQYEEKFEWYIETKKLLSLEKKLNNYSKSYINIRSKENDKRLTKIVNLKSSEISLEDDLKSKIEFLWFIVIVLENFSNFMVEQNKENEPLLHYTTLNETGIFGFNKLKKTIERENISRTKEHFEIFKNKIEAMGEHSINLLRVYAINWKSYGINSYPNILIDLLLKLVVLIPSTFLILNKPQDKKYDIFSILKKSEYFCKVIGELSQTASLSISVLQIELMKFQYKINLEESTEKYKKEEILEDIECTIPIENEIKETWNKEILYLKFYILWTDFQKSLKQDEKKLLEIFTEFKLRKNENNDLLENKIRLVASFIILLLIEYEKQHIFITNMNLLSLELIKTGTNIISLAYLYFNENKIVNLEIISKIVKHKLTLYKNEFEQKNYEKTDNAVEESEKRELTISIQKYNEYKKEYNFEKEIKEFIRIIKRSVNIDKNEFLFFSSRPSLFSEKIINNCCEKIKEEFKKIESVIRKELLLPQTFESLLMKSKNISLILYCDTLIKKTKTYILMIDDALDEFPIEVNEAFFKRFNFENVNTILIIGINSNICIQQIKEIHLRLKNKEISLSYISLTAFKNISEKHVENHEIINIEIEKYFLLWFNEFKQIKNEKILSKNSAKNNVKHKEVLFEISNNQNFFFFNEEGKCNDLSQGNFVSTNIYSHKHNLEIINSKSYLIYNNYLEYDQEKEIKAILQNVRKEKKNISLFGDKFLIQNIFLPVLIAVWRNTLHFPDGMFRICYEKLYKKYDKELELYFSKDKSVEWDKKLLSNNKPAKMLLIFDNFEYFRCNNRNQRYFRDFSNKKITLLFISKQKIGEILLTAKEFKNILNKPYEIEIKNNVKHS